MMPSDSRESFNNVCWEVKRRTRRIQKQAYPPTCSKLYHFPKMVPRDTRGSFKNKSRTSLAKNSINKNLDK